MTSAGDDVRVEATVEVGAGPDAARREAIREDAAGAGVTDAEHDAAATVEPEVVWPVALEEIVAKARERFGVPTINAMQRNSLPEGTLVVDVRGASETAVSTIANARRLQSESAREAFLDEPPATPVLVYCTAGWRSAEFTQQLREAGVEAYNLEGGLCAWALFGQPIVDEQGAATRRIHSYSEDWADCVPEGYSAVW